MVKRRSSYLLLSLASGALTSAAVLPGSEIGCKGICCQPPIPARLSLRLAPRRARRLDTAERTRLGAVTLSALEGYAPIWCRAEKLADSCPEWQGFSVQELGWMEPSRYVPLAREVVRSKILAPLRELGLILPEQELERLLA